MKKKVLCLAMTLIMLAGTGMTAHAEDYQGEDGWKADFNGKKIISNFDSDKLADEAGNVQPGDSITLKVQVKNSDKKSTDWYMTNEAIQSLEDAQAVAQGGAYSYLLTYTDPDGKVTEIYNSDTVGGENIGEDNPDALSEDAEKPVGLHQATSTLEEYFFLDRLAAGEAGTVSLRVKVEGETQNNDYQKTLAKLKMTFAVEKVTSTVINRVPGKTTIITNRVQTGDTAQVLLFCALGLGSGILLLILGVMSMKKRRESKKGE